MTFTVGAWPPVEGCAHCAEWRGECPAHVSAREMRAAAARMSEVHHIVDRVFVAVSRSKATRRRAARDDTRQIAFTFVGFDPRQRTLSLY